MTRVAATRRQRGITDKPTETKQKANRTSASGAMLQLGTRQANIIPRPTAQWCEKCGLAVEPYSASQAYAAAEGSVVVHHAPHHRAGMPIADLPGRHNVSGDIGHNLRKKPRTSLRWPSSMLAKFERPRGM